VYTARPLDATFEEAPREILQTLKIAPEVMHRLTSLGAVAFTGLTSEGVAAKVTINPVSSTGSKGDIILG
jgi:hypothetical protein